MKYRITTTCIAILLMSLLLSPLPIVQADTGLVELAIEPASLSAASGSVFSLAVSADSGSQAFDGISIHLQFDPVSFQNVDANGTASTIVNTATAWATPSVNQVDNAQGTIDFVTATNTGTVSGKVSLFSVQLKAIAAGGNISSVTFRTSKPFNSAKLGVTTLSCDIDHAQNTTITIVSTTGPSETPTPTEVPTPVTTPTPAETPTPVETPTLVVTPTPVETPTPTPSSPSFPDLAGHWAEQAVNSLVSQNLVSGYPDGTFKPDQPITRAELVTILVKALNLQPATVTSTLTDVQGSWAASSIDSALTAGIVTGYPDGTFRPDQLVTRAEEATILVRAKVMTLATPTVPTFSDVQPSFWAFSFIESAKAGNLVTGYPDGTFQPDKTSTRAEACTMIARMLAS